jgi:hypothetical protein
MALPVTVSRSDGVLEYWSDGLSLMHFIHQRFLDALCLKLQKIGVGSSFFQYSITPTLHKYVEQSRIMESPLPGGKPKPGPLGLDSLLFCLSGDDDEHRNPHLQRS